METETSKNVNKWLRLDRRLSRILGSTSYRALQDTVLLCEYNSGDEFPACVDEAKRKEMTTRKESLKSKETNLVELINSDVMSQPTHSS
jgi:hypothetical protein